MAEGHNNVRLGWGWLMPLAAAAAGAAGLWFWTKTSAPDELQPRLPGADRPAEAAAAPHLAPEPGELKGFPRPVQPPSLPGNWPSFRGPRRDGISLESTGLAEAWGPGEPKVRWSVAVGEGHAGAAVLNSRVYVLDYDRRRQRDVVRCLALADGRDIWQFSYPVRIKRNHGMSRTVPAVTNDAVVTLGPKCQVTCLDAASGRYRWSLDLVRDQGATVPPWYAGQCPLIDEGRVILAPGGPDALLMAVECATGRVVWKTPNPRGWTMTHSSVVPVEFGGRRMFVYCASGGVVGVAADDGQVWWETDAWRISIATIPAPVPVGPGRLFLAGGYNAGSLMLALRQAGDRIEPEVAFRLPPQTFGADQQTPIMYNGSLYGVRPGGELVCLDLAGQVRWASGAGRRFGLGPYVLADGKLFVLADSGTLTMVRATAEGYQPLGQAKILDGPDAWGPLAVAGTRLIARDLTRMVCVELGRDN